MLLDVISPLKRQTLSPSLHHLVIQQMTAIYESGKWASPDSKSADILVLDVPTSRTVRNSYLLFKSLSYGSLVMVAWMDVLKKSNENLDKILLQNSFLEFLMPLSRSQWEHLTGRRTLDTRWLGIGNFLAFLPLKPRRRLWSIWMGQSTLSNISLCE
jgi:hypothetical protein